MSHYFIKITGDGHCSPRSAGACLLFYQDKNQTNNKQLSAIQMLHNIGYDDNQLFKGSQKSKLAKLLSNKNQFYTNEVNTAANPGSMMNWRIAKALNLVKNTPVALSRNAYTLHRDGSVTVNNKYKNKVLFLHSGSTRSGHWNIALPITQEHLNRKLAFELSRASI